MLLKPGAQRIRAQRKDRAEIVLVGRSLAVEAIPPDERVPLGIIVRINAELQMIDLVLLHRAQKKEPAKSVLGLAVVGLRRRWRQGDAYRFWPAMPFGLDRAGWFWLEHA